jgi:hypothetical protein
MVRDGICTLGRSHKFSRKNIVLTRLHKWQPFVSNCTPEEYQFKLAAVLKEKEGKEVTVRKG